jgi:hypothetical protein
MRRPCRFAEDAGRLIHYCALDQNKRRFAVPVGTPLRRFGVAALTMALRTVNGDAKGSLCRYRAATPATWGAAIDVPLKVAVAPSLVYQADWMLEPGAKTSTTLPTFENDDRASPLVDDPTVIASLTLAGEEFPAFVFEFPAAIE